jgi:tRNA(Ile)-lysidine synthetase-like protein
MELLEGANARHLEQVLALCAGEDPSARLDLPGCTVRRVYDRLEILAEEGERSLPAAALSIGETRWGAWRIDCEETLCPARAYVSREEFYLRPGSYLVRSRREGDGLQLGKRPWKTVKKLMIDGKIPRHLRALVPVLAGEETAAVGGFGPHFGALALPGEESLHIIMRKGE